MDIDVRKPDEIQLEEMGIKSWPIWEKERSRFDWFYDQKEICYFLEGKVEVEFGDNQRISMGKGDLVTFPKGLRCVWNVKEKVRKHYNFE